MPESSQSGISDSIEAQRGHSRKNHRVYVFTINILKVTRIPSPMRLSFSAGSNLLRIPSKRTLKITVLHGSKQQEIGDFDVVQDQCIIDQRISCRLFCAREEDLGKLHIYIDEAFSSGLAGHIALDLKEFLQDMDTEVYIKYPLSASSPRGGYVPKLKMTLECSCLGNPEDVPDVDTIIHHRASILETKFMDEGMGDYNADALSLLGRNHELDDCDQEGKLLEELQTVLRNLDAKIENCALECEKDIPVDSSSTVTKKTIVDERLTSVPANSDFRQDECSDCAVCSTVLMDKFESISPSFGRSDDEETVELACTKSSPQKQQQQQQQPQQSQQPQVMETNSRPSVLRHVVGGLLLVGLSALTFRTIRRKNERGGQVWPRNARLERENSRLE